MLGNVICWAFALGTIFSKSNSTEDIYAKMVLAMGFIFLGILSKAVDVYRDIHNNNKQNT